MGTKANLLSGVGALYIGPVGEALPEIDDITPPTITVTPAGNWVQVGFTQDNHEFDTETEWEDTMVNESLGACQTVCVKEGGMFKLKFAEKDLLAIQTALSSRLTLSTVSEGADQTGQDIIGFGDKATSTEKALLYLATNPEGGSRLVHIPIAMAVENLNMIRSLKQEGFNMGFKMLADTTQPAGETIYKIYDITTAASS
jgi:hypothetical protein